MNTTTHHALNAYSKIGVETDVANASPHKLISMLFEGALLSVAAARSHMLRKDVKDIAAKGAAISRAIGIIDEGLKVSLDDKVGGELAQNLKALYEYMCQRLLEANLQNDVEKLNEVGRLLSGLKGAWDSIGKSQVAIGLVAAPRPELAPQHASLSYGKA